MNDEQKNQSICKRERKRERERKRRGGEGLDAVRQVAKYSTSGGNVRTIAR